MALLISFSIDRFDLSGEKPNPINPVPEQSYQDLVPDRDFVCPEPDSRSLLSGAIRKNIRNRAEPPVG